MSWYFILWLVLGWWLKFIDYLELYIEELFLFFMKRLMDKVSILEKGVSGIYEGVVRLDMWLFF